jgi:DNA-binding response OmpR family regulator
VAILVSDDLLARSRLEDAAARAGWRLEVARAGDLVARVAASDAELLVLDLDAGGRELLHGVSEAGKRGQMPARVVGFFSHVDAALGEAARAAGCDAMPRGKFWRALPVLLGG